jgi:hypothetical protein
VTKAKQLTMGADSSSPTPDEEKERIAVLRALLGGSKPLTRRMRKTARWCFTKTHSLPDIMTMSTPCLVWP